MKKTKKRIASVLLSALSFSMIFSISFIPAAAKSREEVYELEGTVAEEAGRFIYTTSSDDVNGFIDTGYYRFNGVAFYAPTETEDGAVPVSLLANEETGDIFYAFESREKSRMLSQGFSDEGTAFYVYPDSSFGGEEIDYFYSENKCFQRFTKDPAVIEEMDKLVKEAQEEAQKEAGKEEQTDSQTEAVESGIKLEGEGGEELDEEAEAEARRWEEDAARRAKNDWKRLPSWYGAKPVVKTPAYRLFNPITGEHLYTLDTNERDILSQQYGWKYEGEGFTTYSDGSEVYRFFNTGNGEHFWTSNEKEKDVLINQPGFSFEGVVWYDDPGENSVYRLCDPKTGRHLYTESETELNYLTGREGWISEGLVF